ncbi:MAG: hypothetical protein ACR2NG_07455 [Acidimicrobiia bacterium]
MKHLHRSMVLGLALALMLGSAACSSSETDDVTTSTSADTSTTIATAVTAVSGVGEEQASLVTDVVAHKTTQEIFVTAPGGPETEGWGTWPVVSLLHGRGGDGSGLALTAEALAREGLVVFSATYRFAEPHNIEMDAACAYRYSGTLAERYGGDLSKPSTIVGHSMGASVGLYGGMNLAAYGPDGTFDGCFTGEVIPELFVPIAGCHYEYQGTEFGFDMSEFSNHDAEVVVVVGTDDQVCEAWQSRDATEALQAAGFNARLVELEGGNHANVVFYEIVGTDWVSAPDDPVGNMVVQTIVEAIAEAGQ